MIQNVSKNKLSLGVIILNNKDRYLKLKDKLISDMQRIDKILNTMDKYSVINDNDNLETIVFKKYLELENVNMVAEYLKVNGYRIKTESHAGQRQYIGRDITDILIRDDVDVDEELKDVVQYLQEKNYNAMLKRWG